MAPSIPVENEPLLAIKEKQPSAKPSFTRWYLGALAGGTLGLSWTAPISWSASVFGIIAACFFVLLARRGESLGPLFLAGVIFHPIGFHWLFGTIAQFGGFPFPLALFFFALFCLVSSLQLVLFGFFARVLLTQTKRLACGISLAWVFSEMLFPRVFPWMLGHTQLVHLHFIQSADIIGSYGISFLTLWVAEAALAPRSKKLAKVACTLVLLTTLGYGQIRLEQFSHQSAASPASLLERKQPVVLVQGNVSLTQKHDQQSYRRNVERYKALSTPYNTPETLIIWPETAIMEWIFAAVGDAKNDPRIPFFRGGAGLLVGGLTFLENDQFFNSSLAIYPSGTIPTPYHKRVLMPFGEYTPLSETFPILKEINQNAGDFQKGTGISVFSFPLRSKNREPITLRVAPLICYEDIIQQQAADATRAGAQLLVNQTNDAWFGKSIAPYQHHALAVLRAVENRRYLLRATNTGLTAVVDPSGETLSTLPLFEEGVLATEVHAVNHMTLYTKLFGTTPFWSLMILSLLAAVFRWLKPKAATTS